MMCDNNRSAKVWQLLGTIILSYRNTRIRGYWQCVQNTKTLLEMMKIFILAQIRNQSSVLTYIYNTSISTVYNIIKMPHTLTLTILTSTSENKLQNHKVKLPNIKSNYNLLSLQLQIYTPKSSSQSPNPYPTNSYKYLLTSHL